MERRSRLTLVATVALLACLIGTAHLLRCDVSGYHVPTKEFLRRWLVRGVLPEWCPLTALGYPFAASGQVGVFNPVDLVLLLALGAPLAVWTGIVLHLAAAGLFAGLYFRRVLGGTAPAVVGTVVLVLSPFLAIRLLAGHYPIIRTLPCLTWVLYLLVRPRTPSIAALVVPLSLLLVGFHPQAAFYVIAALALRGALGLTRREDRPRSLRLLAAALIAPAVAAIQLLPELLHAASTQRGLDLGASSGRHIALRLSDLLPVLIGRFRVFDGSLHELARYGAIGFPAALGILALVRTRPRREGVDPLFWLLLSGGSLALGLGDHLPWVSRLNHLPPLAMFRAPARILMLLSLGAGGGAAYLVARCRARSVRLGLVVAIVAIVVALGQWVPLMQSPCCLEISLPRPAVEEALRTEIGTQYRCAGLQNLALTLGLRTADAYEPLLPRYYVEMWNLGQGMGPGRYVTTTTVAHPTPLLSLFGVRALWDPEGRLPSLESVPGLPEVKRWPHPLPRGMLYYDYRVMPQRDIVLGLVSGRLDPTRHLFLETPPDVTPADLPPEIVEILDLDPNRVTCRVTARRDGLLLVGDLYHDGWSATVDDRPAPILPADFLLRAVPVPRGTHQVAMAFRQAGLRPGALISLVSVLGLVLGTAVHRRRGAGSD